MFFWIKTFLPKRSLLSFVFFFLHLYFFIVSHEISPRAEKNLHIHLDIWSACFFVHVHTCVNMCNFIGFAGIQWSEFMEKSFDRFSFCDGNLCIFPARSYMEYSFLLFWHCSWTTRCRKPRAAHTITRTENESHDNLYFANSLQIIPYNQEILYATLRSSYHYLLRSR